MNGKEKLLALYIVCNLILDLTFMGGCAYAVFWLGFSGWWFVLAVACCMPSSAIIKYTTGIDIYK